MQHRCRHLTIYKGRLYMIVGSNINKRDMVRSSSMHEQKEKYISVPSGFRTETKCEILSEPCSIVPKIAAVIQVGVLVFILCSMFSRNQLDNMLCVVILTFEWRRKRTQVFVYKQKETRSYSCYR